MPPSCHSRIVLAGIHFVLPTGGKLKTVPSWQFAVGGWQQAWGMELGAASGEPLAGWNFGIGISLGFGMYLDLGLTLNVAL